jgi:hypothetical protein
MKCLTPSRNWLLRRKKIPALNVSRSLILLFFWLAVAGRAFGVCTELPVTPTSLDTYSYRFAVSTHTVTNGVAFHITIAAKGDDIDTNYCAAHLDTVRHNGGTEIGQEQFEKAIPVTVQKQPRKWTIDFALPHELLKDPNLFFVFWEQAVDRAQGKAVPMPSGDFYEMRLRDFAR